VGSEEGGKCGTISERGGVIGAAAARVGGGSGGAWSGFQKKKTLGGAHAAVRGEGGGGLGRPTPRPSGEGGWWLGLGEGGGPREREGEWARKEGEVGPREMGSGPVGGQGPGGWWAGPEGGGIEVG
jgi:hypothetical protein